MSSKCVASVAGKGATTGALDRLGWLCIDMIDCTELLGTCCFCCVADGSFSLPTTRGLRDMVTAGRLGGGWGGMRAALVGYRDQCECVYSMRQSEGIDGNTLHDGLSGDVMRTLACRPWLFIVMACVILLMASHMMLCAKHSQTDLGGFRGFVCKQVTSARFIPACVFCKFFLGLWVCGSGEQVTGSNKTPHPMVDRHPMVDCVARTDGMACDVGCEVIVKTLGAGPNTSCYDYVNDGGGKEAGHTYVWTKCR